ncbi:MAG: radical SAM protein [Deltaproteobacteria bacterium]|nr:radical SAM protein [Deltaproteobacteria bacterium]
MASIALIRPPLVATQRSYSVIIAPPLGLAYVAAALEAAGHLPTVIDALAEAPEARRPSAYPGSMAYGLSIEEIVARIPSDAQAIGLSVMFSQQWPHVEALARAIHARWPRLPIIVGGEHATAAWHYLLAHCPEVTVCVLGEGEQAAVELAEWIDGRRALEEVAGIALRRDGVPQRTAARPRVRQPETLPRPAWHLFPMEEYLSRGLGHGVNRGRSMPMLATRGCPFQCTFCSSPDMWTTRYVTRPVADVVDEIASYVERYRITNVDFEDLTAFVKRDWILAFCAELERRAVRITYQLPSGTRSEALDREVLEALYRTGCRNLTYAPESGSRRTLERIKKRVHLDRMLASMRAAVEVGIVTKVNMVIGFPFEERRDIFDTLRFCFKLAWIGVEDIPLFPYCPYPGSALYDELRASGRVPEMSNAYFASLQFSDMAHVAEVSRHLSRRELAVYRSLGMALFILVGYVRTPSRVWRTVRNLASGRSESAVEDRLTQLIVQPLRHAFAGRAAARGGGAARARAVKEVAV